ncbi:MAG: methylated-DNA--[protein]-cysteine S-methyltransferase [Longicatena sp.]
MYVEYYHSKIGWLKIVANYKAIIELTYVEQKQDANPNEITQACILQLAQYFNGSRTTFELPLEVNGTLFQEKVWKVVASIPYGETRSYKSVAKLCGNDKASRAVGNANNHNPIAIIIPCHRVIGSNGKLVGYAYGTQKKQFLLELEKEHKKFEQK